MLRRDFRARCLQARCYALRARYARYAATLHEAVDADTPPRCAILREPPLRFTEQYCALTLLIRYALLLLFIIVYVTARGEEQALRERRFIRYCRHLIITRRLRYAMPITFIDAPLLILR